MKVMKFGGSCLKNAVDFQRVSKIIMKEQDQKIVVLSGVNGVTDTLQRYLNSRNHGEHAIKELIHSLYALHIKILSGVITNQAISKDIWERIREKLEKLERILRGVLYIDELTERTRALILSYGERLSVLILEGALTARNVKAKAFEANNIGIITDSDFGNATAILSKIASNFQRSILPVIKKGIVPVITGFFGCDSEGRVTTFGRNGSDYSASVIATAVNASVVEIWKDVDGFMSADPCVVNHAHLIDKLSYREAAELAYFGAKILHPRSVEPLLQRNIVMHIKSIYNPESKGTEISEKGYEGKNVIKSISYNKDIAVIKIHGSGVGNKPGVLSEIVSCISSNNINIQSVITSQTCINLIVGKKDLHQSYHLLTLEKIKTVEKMEKIRNIALIGVVGEGILGHHGVAARVFSVVAKKGINIEMIVAGASEVAYYFIVKEEALRTAIKAIHREFFN